MFSIYISGRNGRVVCASTEQRRCPNSLAMSADNPGRLSLNFHVSTKCKYRFDCRYIAKRTPRTGLCWPLGGRRQPSPLYATLSTHATPLSPTAAARHRQPFLNLGFFMYFMCCLLRSSDRIDISILWKFFFSKCTHTEYFHIEFWVYFNIDSTFFYEFYLEFYKRPIRF